MATSNDILAVSFDLDDTLWPVAPVLERAERKLLEWLTENFPRVPERHDLASLRAIREDLMRTQPELAEDMTGLRKAVLAHIGREAGYGEDLTEAAFEVFLHYRNQIDFYPETLAVLHELRGRFRLGTISNGNADIVRIGLADLMSFVVSAESVGKAKPHPDVFRSAASVAGIPESAIVHVGDDPRTDVLGAKRAGWRAIWLNRAGVAWPEDTHPDVRPDAVIHTLSELSQALDNLTSRGD